VLKAIGLEDAMAHASIRFGIGRFNGQDEIDYTVKRVVEEVTRLREISPVYRAKKSRLQYPRHGDTKPRETVS
jgi:cysteine desulfurase